MLLNANLKEAISAVSIRLCEVTSSARWVGIISKVTNFSYFFLYIK